jgi:methylated-DNA-[protein]-cysteine S-methyltransferase
MIYYMEHRSPLGNLLVATTERGLCGLYFEQHKYFKGNDEWKFQPHHAHLRLAAHQLEEYFGGGRRVFDLPLDLHGTEFQRKIWQALSSIEYGKTSSYLEQAQLHGNSNATRAVGTAIGRNPLCIIVPCHRVIGSSGALTGYAGGIKNKRFLLSFEAKKRIAFE